MQSDQLNMAVCFWYLGKSYLSICTRVQWRTLDKSLYISYQKNTAGHGLKSEKKKEKLFIIRVWVLGIIHTNILFMYIYYFVKIQYFKKKNYGGGGQNFPKIAQKNIH